MRVGFLYTRHMNERFKPHTYEGEKREVGMVLRRVLIPLVNSNCFLVRRVKLRRVLRVCPKYFPK